MVKNSTRSMEVIKPCNSRRDDCTLLLCRSTEVSVSKGIVTHIGPFELVRISLNNNRQVTQKSQKSFSRHVMEKSFEFDEFRYVVTTCFPSCSVGPFLGKCYQTENKIMWLRWALRGIFRTIFARPLLWPFVTLNKTFFVAVLTKTT